MTHIDVLNISALLFLFPFIYIELYLSISYMWDFMPDMEEHWYFLSSVPSVEIIPKAKSH